MIVFGWFILLIMLIKFCEDGHNPIYTSIRVGKNGKLIKFHKIRSMVPNAENMKQQLIEQGLNEADGPAFKMKDDSRITKIGKFLRKTSLDELPQIWDIFVGSLSVIGPRSPIPSDLLHVVIATNLKFNFEKISKKFKSLFLSDTPIRTYVHNFVDTHFVPVM